MTTPVVPSYPKDSPALLRLLLQHERARLLGPVIETAVVSDETLKTRILRGIALGELDAAEKWVERAASFEGY